MTTATNLQNPGSQMASPKSSLTNLLTQESVKKRFEEMLGKKAPGFISSIISATKANPALAECDSNSILSAAVIAATLDLPIQNNLGFAALVPYKEGGGQPVAQFQMMWRGYVQLAMRTAQYNKINVSEVYEGELIKEDRIMGEYVFDTTKKKSDKVIGYVAYFRMINGFEKYFYWTVEQVTKHAKQYSQSFRSHKPHVVERSRWTLDFDAMAKKTVLKLLLSKFGIMSVDMQMALTVDQAIVKDHETIDVEYKDNPPTAAGEEKKESLRGRKKKDPAPADVPPPATAGPSLTAPSHPPVQGSLPLDEAGNISMP